MLMTKENSLRSLKEECATELWVGKKMHKDALKKCNGAELFQQNMSVW